MEAGSAHLTTSCHTPASSKFLYLLISCAFLIYLWISVGQHFQVKVIPILKDFDWPGRVRPVLNGSGKRIGLFTVKDEILKAIRWPIRNYVQLTRDNLDQFVFVTAADRAYFQRVLDAIGTVQRHFPNKKIIFYDLQHDKLAGWQEREIRSLCNVEYRRFNMSMLPEHVRRLKTYAWKPIVIHEVLQDYAGVFWMDSSIRFQSGNLSEVFQFVKKSDGAMLFNACGHNTFQVTHHRMYDYLPTNLTEMKRVPQYEANLMLLYKTRPVYDEVIGWWVLCALTSECIAPTSELHCHLTDSDRYADCHRFDQSAINILLANRYRYDHTRYVRFIPGFDLVLRAAWPKEEHLHCV